MCHSFKRFGCKTVFSSQKGAELMKPMDWAKEKYSPQNHARPLTHTHTPMCLYTYTRKKTKFSLQARLNRRTAKSAVHATSGQNA
jgi:hypothetical protein